MKKFTIVGTILVMITVARTTESVAQESAAPWVPIVGGPQYFAVLVADADTSAAWYCKAFGLRELDRSNAEDGSWQIVNLRNDDLFVEIIRDDRAKSVVSARGFAKVGFQVPDVDTVAIVVSRATGERPRVLEFPPHGVRLIQIRDPDGNIIQLTSPLKGE